MLVFMSRERSNFCFVKEEKRWHADVKSISISLFVLCNSCLSQSFPRASMTTSLVKVFRVDGCGPSMIGNRVQYQNWIITLIYRRTKGAPFEQTSKELQILSERKYKGHSSRNVISSSGVTVIFIRRHVLKHLSPSHEKKDCDCRLLLRWD